MRPRFDGQHNVLATENTRHGVHSTGDGLSQEHQVRCDPTPFMTQKLSRAGNTGLDLVTDQQDIVLIAQGPGVTQVLLVRNDNTCLALNRLNQEGR